MNTCTCAIMGTSVDALECAEIMASSGQDMAAKCAKCPRPQPTGAETTAFEPPTAWQRIQQATGVGSFGKLAEHLRCGVSTIYTQLVRLDAGKLPNSNNTFIPALLRFTGLRLCDFIPGAPTTFDPDPGEAGMPVQVQAMAQANAAVSSAFGPLAEVAESAAAPLVDSSGAAVQVPAGDLAADLANPPTIQHMPDQAPLTLMGADPDDELITEGEATGLLASARAQAAPTEQDDADGWEAYTGYNAHRHAAPVLIVDKGGKLGLSAEAARQFSLAAGERVCLRYNRRLGQIGIVPNCAKDAPGALVIQGGNGTLLRINMSGFCRAFGLRPVSGQYPLHRAPSGMLVATIELENEEAKAS